MALNSVCLNGRLTREPSMNATRGGTEVLSFSLAVNRNYKNKQTNQYDADFPNCVAWGKTAELIAQHCHKGDLISVQGELQTRTYEDKNGNKRFATEVNVHQIGFLNSKCQNGAQRPQQNQPAQYNAPAGNQPQPMQNQPVDPFASNSGAVDISADDLPF